MKGNTLERLCVSCRTYRKKEELIRIARTEESFVVEPKKNVFGRSAYVCRNAQCLTRMKEKHLLSKSFHRAVPDQVYEEALQAGGVHD